VDTATRARILDLLVDEQYARALAKGHVIRNPQGWRAACRASTERQAHDQTGWLEQQADRLLGEQKRPGAALECPACGITFHPHDAEAVRADDGLTYCRLACAAGEPTVTLDEWLAAHPHRLVAGAFARVYLEQTGQRERLGDLAPLDADDTRL
jgi:regulator of sirC expression with transglutaminase-like and TPR domain